MGSSSRSNWRISYGMFMVVGLICVLVGCLAGNSQAEKTGGQEKSGGNSKCYVCHAGMKTEELTTNHLAIDVTCDSCHGASIEHMHDEMLMTEPDLLFGRQEVVKMCRHCHKHHENPQAVEAFRKEWTARMRPNGRNITADSVCTDCHGTHNLANETGAEVQDGREAEWLAAFNGSDLSGWKATGGSSWKVKMGRIYGTPPAEAKGGSLWSEDEYEDFLMAITFRVEKPVDAGIWVRGDGDKPTARVEILQSDRPNAYSGSVLVPQKGLVLVNLRSDLLDDGGWNTISVKAEGDRIHVWLNAEEIGAVHTAGPTKGKIGLYVAGNAAGKAGEFCVREVQIQKLAKSDKSAK